MLLLLKTGIRENEFASLKFNICKIEEKNQSYKKCKRESRKNGIDYIYNEEAA